MNADSQSVEALDATTVPPTLQGGRSRRARIATLLPTAVVVLVCAGLLSWLQFSFNGMEDSDSYFHTRAARELDQFGIRKTFPQAVYSTWSTSYSDKDWLFHVFLIPFQRVSLKAKGAPGDHGVTEDLVTPGKWAMIPLYVLYFSALGGCLWANQARYPWLWMVLYLSIDTHVIWRLLPVRPGILAGLLLLLEIAFITRKNGPGLAVVEALHTYSHSSFFLAPMFAAASVTANFLRREPLQLRMLAWALAGPAAASIVHPYFPNNIGVAWEQLSGVAQYVWLGKNEIPVELFGTELRGVDTQDFMHLALGMLPAAGGVVAFLVGRRRVSTDGLALTLIAGLLLTAGLLSYRFMDFFLPVVVVLGARLWSELMGGESLRVLARGDTRMFVPAAGLLTLCLTGSLAKRDVSVVHEQFAHTTMGAEYQRPAIEFLKRVARPEEIVYHNFWQDFSILYHFRPDGRYIEALDPIFFQRFDPQLFQKSVAIMNGSAQDVHGIIKNDFGARWVYVARNPLFVTMVESLIADSGFRKAYKDEEALIFRVE